MTKSFTILFFLFCITSSFAQIDTYPMADYYRPDLERKTANYSGDIRFVNENRDNIVNGKSSETSFSLSGSAEFSNFRNTLNNQISSYTSYSLNNNYTTNKQAIGRESSTTIAPNIYRSYSNKRFKNGGKRFFELGYLFDLDSYFNTSSDTGMTTRVYEKELRLDIDVPLYWGKGRIEIVNDAWLAATTLEFLMDESLLKNPPISHETITNFANRIAEIRQFRNTDFRLENIAEYEALVQYLADNNIIDPNNYKTFAVLRDAWVYESFITRRSGKELKFGLIPSSYNRRNVVSDESFFDEGIIDFFDNYGIMGSIAYNSYKPTNLNWQKDLTNQLDFGFSFPRYDGSSNNEKLFRTRLSLGQSFNYIPNQRTNFRLNLSSSYLYSRSLSDDTIFVDRHTLNASVSARYNYYISPKLLWSVRGNFSFFGGLSDISNYYSNTNGIFASISYRPY